MTPRDLPAVRGKRLGMCGDVGVGELGPTLNIRHDDTAGRGWVDVADLRDTFHEGGGGLLVKPPPHPLPRRPFALPTPREFGISSLLLTERGVEQQLRNVPHKFLLATAPGPHHHCSTPPRNPLLPQAPEAQCSRSHQQC